MTSTWLPPEQYIETIARASSYACLFFTDTRDRPVQLRAVYNEGQWQWPGGNMDPGETPWECAVRECLEETGIVFEGAPVLRGVTFGGPDGDWPANKIGFVFDGGSLTDGQLDAIVLDPSEHSEFRVHTLEEWRSLMTPEAFVRLGAVAEARRTGTVAYLEHPRG
ncbi:NUDIX domain-containing protein [Streptomyces sp. NPDC101132]|uniref:NUDIX domain-containing protein n=1 Tax=Streptomyces sp. NPDC101132 TaxID=3366110 RepID=UPI003812C91C